MDFKQEINELEKYLTENNFEIKTGSVPILFSAPHTMIQTHHMEQLNLVNHILKLYHYI